MPGKQDEFAKVEYQFLRFDDRYKSLAWGEKDCLARAYLHVWCTCVEIRRDTFSRDVVISGSLSDRCGVPQSVLLECIDECVAIGLLSRGPGGVITVDGVRRKHSGLRGWNADPVRNKVVRPMQAREGEREEELEGECAEDSEPSEGDASEQAIFEFPSGLIAAGNGHPFVVRLSRHDRYVAAYPAVNCLTEYAKMASWLESNPARRKTLRGLPRFINSWLGRAQDRRPTQPDGPPVRREPTFDKPVPPRPADPPRPGHPGSL